MSGENRVVDNASDQIRLGRDLLLRNCREHYEDDAALCELLKWHHGFVIPRRLSWEKVRKETRAPIDLMWAAWHGKADAEQVAEYKRLIGAYRKRCEAEGQLVFCETSYSEEIWHTCDVALHHTLRGRGTQCHVRGDAGCGKTLVSRSWHQTNNHGRSIFFEPKGAGGTRALLEDLALVLGVDRKSSFSKLLLRVFGCFEPGMVLIVDEVSLLVRERSAKQPLLDLLRRICDTTGCSLVTLATDDKFESDLATSSWNDRQWWRRMSRIVDLPRISPKPEADIQALFDFKFPKFELRRELMDTLVLVNEHDKGGFGQVAKIFDDAMVEAELAGRAVAAKDIAVCLEQKIKALKALAARSVRRLR